MPRLVPLALGLALLAGAVGSQPLPAPAPVIPPGIPFPGKTLLTVKEVMRHIVNPAAELYWKAAGEVDTAEGEIHRAPKPEDNDRWAAAVNAAAVLQESGNLLMLQGRARDDKQWMKIAQQLADAGALAKTAAEARDEKKTFDAGSALYDACYACHGRYIPRPKNSLYTHKTPDEAFKPPM